MSAVLGSQSSGNAHFFVFSLVAKPDLNCCLSVVFLNPLGVRIHKFCCRNSNVFEYGVLPQT